MTNIPPVSGIRIAIADDNLFVRVGLRRCISLFHDFHFAGEAASVEEALELVQKQDIDVLLLDLNMPGMRGIEILPQLRCVVPRVKVVVLSASTDSSVIYAALRAGAYAYLEKPLNPERINQAIRSAAAARPRAANQDQFQEHQ